MSTGGSSVPRPSSRPRERLTGIRHELVGLHKHVIEGERIPYERTHGRIATRGEFLRLVLHDEWFVWLHPLSELIVAIDQALADEEPVTESVVAAFVERTRALLTHGGSSFGPRYREVLQRDPAVLVAHGRVIGRLATVH